MKAAFRDAHTVEVHTADRGTVTLTGRHIVIGTGSHAVIPDIPGLRDAATLATSTEMPGQMTGPVSWPALVARHRSGVRRDVRRSYRFRATVLERHADILGQEDPDVAACAREVMDAAGVRIVT